MFSDLILFASKIFSVFGAVWFLILPTFLWFLFKSLWGRYAANCWMATQNDILLEITPPQNVEKSPKLMESFFNALASTDAGMNMFWKYAMGKMNPYFSLEIIGKEGIAHFYIRSPKNYRSLVESALYAQYPGVEIKQVDDYVFDVPAIIPNEEWTLWGSDFTLMKDDAYPIKTYKYFDEDVTGKMIDPLSNYMEFISTLGSNQHIWVQYVIQADRPNWYGDWGTPTVDKFLGREKPKPTTFSQKFSHDMGDIFKNVVPALVGKGELTSLSEPKKVDEQPLEFRLTPGEKQALKALEENIAKSMFTVKCRLVVVGKKENFAGTNVNGATSMFKEFSDNYTNQLIPVDRTKTYADYVNVDARKSFRMRQILDRYRDRDDTGVVFHFSTAELATVFHLPDISISAPSVKFTPNRQSNAPVNLPIV